MPVTFVPVTVADAATYTVDAEDSGLTHYVPDLTQDITITLPTPKAGLWFEFVYAGVAADTSDWAIDSGSDTNYFKGGLVYLDTDAGAAADEVLPKAGDGNSNSKITVTTPDVGTRIKVESADGTHWILSGVVMSATAVSFADQS